MCVSTHVASMQMMQPIVGWGTINAFHGMNGVPLRFFAVCDAADFKADY